MIIREGCGIVATERIGIMGGTFDPIHAGHIAMAKAAAVSGALDRVLILPSGNPPHKKGITPAEDRWRMVCAAVAQEPLLEPCRLEVDRTGVIYTVDTLSELHAIYPEAELFYIIGEDTLLELKNWRQYERVITLCTFLICPRSIPASPEALAAEEARLTAMGGSFLHVTMDPVDVSSTAVRRALEGGGEASLLPVVCQEYAELMGLYGLPARLTGEQQGWMAKLFDALSRKRFAHTLAVAQAARELALRHGLDAQKAELAGVLHDCAKCLPEAEMRAICLDNGLTDDPAVLASGNLMHSLVGAYLAQQAYGMQDEAVLTAIRVHTMGQPGMSPLDMAVYLADKIEKTRRPYPALEAVRSAAQRSLREAMLLSLGGTAEYVRSRGEALHPLSEQTLQWLKQTN